MTATKTPGGEPPEPVEERPVVGEVTPKDYPLKERRASDPAGEVDNTDLLGPDGWDKPGSGEIGGAEPSTDGEAKDPARTNPA